MADTKYPIIRYQTLDWCFRNKYKRYYIDDLIDACAEAIYNHCGKEIGCSRRTILSDINFMESEGGWRIPLVRHKDGRKVWYRYRDTDFTINETLLTESDYNKLNEAVMLLERFKGMPCFEWIDDLLFKLQSGFRRSSTAILDFEHVPELKGMEYVNRLFNAILYKQPLEITYQTYRDQTYKWIIHPYLIKQYNNRWFLFGKNTSKGGVISNLALDRIENIEDSGIPYEDNEGLLHEKLDNIIGVTIDWKASIQSVRLKFSENRYQYVVTKPLHPSQTIISEEERIIEISVIPNKELEATILQFGSDVEVISPIEISTQIKEKIEEIKKIYDKCN